MPNKPPAGQRRRVTSERYYGVTRVLSRAPLRRRAWPPLAYKRVRRAEERVTHSPPPSRNENRSGWRAGRNWRFVQGCLKDRQSKDRRGWMRESNREETEKETEHTGQVSYAHLMTLNALRVSLKRAGALAQLHCHSLLLLPPPPIMTADDQAGAVADAGATGQSGSLIAVR
jgi:hypothetical protein